MARRGPSTAQVKARKQRTILIGLCALLVVIAAIQVPKLMKHKSASPVPVAMTTSADGTTPAPATVTPPPRSTAPASSPSTPASGSTPVSAVPAGPTGLAAGRLTKLTGFAIKDPFRTQVQSATGDANAGTAHSAASAPAAPSSKQPATTPAPAPAPAPAKKTTKKPVAATPKAAAPAPTIPTTTVNFTQKPVPPNAAVIRMNGREQVVPLGQGFPTDGPLFKLVKLGKKDVRIGVLGGSFTSGVPTLQLATGRRLILANQADGSRYVLLLVRLTTAVLVAPSPDGSTAAPAGTTATPSSQPATASAPPTTTAAAATPAAAATTTASTPPPAAASTPATTTPAAGSAGAGTAVKPATAG